MLGKDAVEIGRTEPATKRVMLGCVRLLRGSLRTDAMATGGNTFGMEGTDISKGSEGTVRLKSEFAGLIRLATAWRLSVSGSEVTLKDWREMRLDKEGKFLPG